MRIWTLLILALPIWATARTVPMADVSKEDENLLRKELPALFTDSADLATFDEALRILLKTGRYENVYVEERGGVLQLTGKPLRTVDLVQIIGAREVDDAILRELVEIKIGERFDRKKAVSGGEKIKNHYGEKGFFNAVVEIDFQTTQNRNLIVKYTIQENNPCQIAGVSINTPNVDLRKGLESHFKRLLKRNLTLERTQRFMGDLNEYLVTNRYLATEVLGPEIKYNKDRTQALIQLEIRDPYRWEFYFSGFKLETDTDLIRALDLKNRERKNLDPANEGAERLRRHYLVKGFPTVQVDTKVVNPAGGAPFLKRVYFKITEGPKVRVAKIEVQGRISRASKYYQDFILANSSPLVERGYYNRSDLENGFKNLVTELRNQGYLRAKVLSSRIEYNTERTQVTVQLLIEEGPQTQVRALDFEGNKFFSSFELAQVTGLRTNSALRLAQFEGSIEKLKSFYQNAGFLEMRLLNEGEDLIQYNETGSQARILFRIYEGPRIRINNIVVEGNVKTKSRVILKEADFKIGDVLTPTMLEGATARLNKMSLFSRVDIRTLEENTNIAERTLVLSVSEVDPGIFRFGVGVNNERNFTVRGFTGLGYNNLGGTGRGISGRVELKSNVGQINYIENEVAAGYLEPFLFNTLTRGRVNVSRAERVFEFASQDEFTSITVSNRVDFLVERDLTKRTKFTWKAWSLDSRQDFERYGRLLPEGNTPFNPAAGKSPPISAQVASLGPALDIDYRDSAFLPTRGSLTRFVVDYAHPSIGSSDNIEFVKADSNFTFYSRLFSPKIIWANSVRGGYLANLSERENSGVPVSHAFFLGGIYTIRGFDLASDTERIPKQGDDGFTVSTRSTQRLIKTDSHYYLLKSEVRFPIAGDHGGVLFYDGGAVKISGFNFAHTYRDSVGFGYRYNTPVGPVALDFAFKLKALPREDKFRFHLSIGTF